MCNDEGASGKTVDVISEQSIAISEQSYSILFFHYVTIRLEWRDPV